MVVVLGARSSKSKDAKLAAAGTANTVSLAGIARSAQTALYYPDWAKAAPPYLNATVGFLVNTKLYQFRSADDTTTVGDWYQSKVNTPWQVDKTYDSRSTVVNRVQIGISKISGPGGGAGSAKTMIPIPALKVFECQTVTHVSGRNG